MAKRGPRRKPRTSKRAVAKRVSASKGRSGRRAASRGGGTAAKSGKARKTGRAQASSRKSARAPARPAEVKGLPMAAGGPALRAGSSVRRTSGVKSALSRSDLRQFRKRLLLKRAELTGDLSGMQQEALRRNANDGSGSLSRLPDHMADIGSDNYEQEFTLGLIENERSLLRDIDEALERIDQGTYGICAGTGRPIGRGRLEAKPWAKYCIEYARLVEKGQAKPEGNEE